MPVPWCSSCRVPVYQWLRWLAQEAATQEEERTLRTIVAANIEDHCTLWVQTGLKVAQTRRGPGSGGENRANLIKHSDLALDNFLKHTSGSPRGLKDFRWQRKKSLWHEYTEFENYAVRKVE